MIVQPLWMAPPGVQAATTRRHGGGQSRPPFDDFNLAMHVDDDPVAVAANRQRLEHHLGLAQPIAWPQQVHGVEVVDAVGARGCQADAVYSESPGQVCAVLTADCLPVLLARRDGGAVAAVHAGWRGLADGVIEAAVRRFSRPGAELQAWLGAAIGPDSFEVGEDVRQAFLHHDAAADAAFRRHRPGHYLADLYHLARLRLRACGVQQIDGGGECTYRQSQDYFSFRREPRTGRQASLIWIAT